MRLIPVGNPTSSTATSCVDLDVMYVYVYVYPPMRVFPDLRGLLWARELKLYLDWHRPKKEENPCGCRPCRRRAEDDEESNEYWDALLCDGCGGMRRVASPCSRCDSATYHPTYPGAAPKGPPTGFGPYKELPEELAR